MLLVPELHARVSLLDTSYNVVAQLGEDVARITGTKGIRNDNKQWQAGKFVHPHDACFNARGDIFVAEELRDVALADLEAEVIALTDGLRSARNDPLGTLAPGLASTVVAALLKARKKG